MEYEDQLKRASDELTAAKSALSAEREHSLAQERELEKEKETSAALQTQLADLRRGRPDKSGDIGRIYHEDLIRGMPIDAPGLLLYASHRYPGKSLNEELTGKLLSDLDRARYTNIGDVDDAVSSVATAVEDYAAEAPELFKSATDYLTKGLGFADKEFRARHGFSERTRRAFNKYGGGTVRHR